jgi:myosin heavy subunit
MKQLITIFCLLFTFTLVQAQPKDKPKKDKNKGTKTEEPVEKEPKLTKAEKKEYKRKAEELRKEFKANYKDPEKFSQFKKDNANAKRDAAKAKEEVERLKKNDEMHKEQVEALKRMNEEDEAKIRDLQEAIRKKQMASGKPVSPTLSIPTTGTFYAVHVGEANIDALTKILESGAEMRTTDEHQFILGLFPDAKSAQTLRIKAMEMGLRKTNLVIVKNGKLSM